MVAVTAFCVVLGSSSVASLVGPGKKLRWAALLLLAVLALALFLRERRRILASYTLAAAVVLGGWLSALTLVSAAWSVDARLTIGRAASLALLLVVAAALAAVSRVRVQLPIRILEGVLAGATAAAVAGVLMLAVDHADAVQPASTQYPARFRGLGENPDTLAMLEGVAIPIALWLLLRARGAVRRLLLAATLVLLLASGSRGGLVAAFVGGIVVSSTVRLAMRRRLGLVLVVCLAVAGATGATRIPKPLLSAPPAAQHTGNSGPSIPVIGQQEGPAEPQYAGRLTDELFRVYKGPRSLFGSSGRLEAWYTAIQQGDARPLLGYGFGTENQVFVDRVFNFDGSYVENSFIGLYLQLGIIGVVSLLALLGCIATALVSALRHGVAASPGPALAGVVAAGLALMLVQSYVYSVGNVATMSFWLAGFVATALTRQHVRVLAAESEPTTESAVASA